MKYFITARKYASKVVCNPKAAWMAFFTGCVASPAFAEDFTTLITDAQTDGTGNQKAVIAAVIAIAVISFGAGAFLVWLRK